MTNNSPATAITVDRPVPERALAVGAHPDDIEFGAGATLAKWAEAGCEVSFFVCTDGSKGSWDPNINTAKLVVTRQTEATEAARLLGATGEVRFGSSVDGELENNTGTRTELVRAIRELRPDMLLGHDPWKRYRLHPDHRAAGFLTCDALVAARDPHFFSDMGVAHHRPDALLLFEAEFPNHAERVEPGHIEAKIGALECHRSQFESTMFIPDSSSGEESQDAKEAFRSRIREKIAVAGDPFGLLGAESFVFMPTDR